MICKDLSQKGTAPVHKLCRAPSQRCGLPQLQCAEALHLRLKLIRLVAARALASQIHEAQQLFQCKATIMIAAPRVPVTQILDGCEYQSSGEQVASVLLRYIPVYSEEHTQMRWVNSPRGGWEAQCQDLFEHEVVAPLLYQALELVLYTPC